MTTVVELSESKGKERNANTDRQKPSTVRRLNLNLPERTFQELQRLAAESGRSLTEMVRIGIGLAQVAIDEEGHGRKLAVIDQRGQVIKEIVPLR